MRIVIGDDHGFIRDCLGQICRQCDPDVEILEAASYDEVVAIATTAAVDLVTLDLCMPALPPLEGLDLVRSRCSSRVAVISGIEDRSTIRAVLSRGVAGYIPKRLGLSAIASALRLILAGETFVPSLLLEDDGPIPRVASNLTGREREVLALLRDGLSNKGFARRLNLSEVTIKTHLSSAFRKLGVTNRVQAAQFSG